MPKCAFINSYPISDLKGIKQKMLNWSRQFNIFCFLDTHGYSAPAPQYECLLAVGAQSMVNGDTAGLNELDDFLKKKEWAFGHLSYELKDKLFAFSKKKRDPIGFPDFFFFEPEAILIIKGSELVIYSTNPEAVFQQLHKATTGEPTPGTQVTIQPRLTRNEYLEKIEALQKHIQRGDCYEINFCQEFFALQAQIDPFHTYQKLVAASPTPFSAFYRLNDKYLLCASPERFLQKSGHRIIAQPMKGTLKRSKGLTDDLAEQKALKENPKEKAENVMIVDLMRNDLSKICDDASVVVKELFGIYTFPQVYQMVSTIEGKLKEGISFSEIIEATFPMGSMTGAPKQRVLELIDTYEATARGLFSGSVGYFHNGNFDLNVVIRSIFYNHSSGYLSYQAGSGITYYSQPQLEWEECMLKVEAIKKVLTGLAALS